MFRKLLTVGTLVAVIFTVCSSAFASGIKHGNLLIQHPTIRATTPGAKVGAGYVSIKNNGSTTERLFGGTAAFAGKTEIHEMKMESQVMKMRPLKNGLEIPPGETAHLAPGGLHIMFMMLKEPLVEGEERVVSLNFEKAGNLNLEFSVKSIGDTMKLKHKN